MVAILVTQGNNKLAIMITMRPNMDAILLSKGSILYRLYTPAISNPKRTIYTCNFLPRESNMLAIMEIVLEARDYDFWTNLAKT